MRDPRITSLIVDILFLATAVSSAVITPSQFIGGQIRPVSYNENDRLDLGEVLSDSATTAVTSPTANAVDVACNGRAFGSDLNIQSCLDALRLIPPGRQQNSFAMRYGPAGAQSDVKLPYRWLSPDGLCNFRVYLVEPAVQAHASFLEIFLAATTVMNTCVNSARSKGGVASNIGGDNKLAVVVAKSEKSDVHCLPNTRAPSAAACHAIIDTIDATRHLTLFGDPFLQPPAEQPLPDFLSDGSRYYGNFAGNDEKDVGVYVGSCANDYNDNVASHPPNAAYSTVGTLRAFQCGRVSHYFGWTGPSSTIDAACSSSAVEIDTTSRAIQTGGCSQALDGGVNVVTNPIFYQNLDGVSFLIRTGPTKPSDDRAM
ncbi:MAG: hypothetical protein Q9199_002312 [Rusavskia elegans]